MAGHAGYLAELDQMKVLHEKKASDYGSDADPFANIRASQDIGISPAKGAWLRAKDKVKRLDRFFSGNALVNESAEDSLRDLAAYCLISLVLLQEGKEKVDEKSLSIFQNCKIVRSESFP